MSKQVIGLDIGTHGIRAVELSDRRGKPAVRRVGELELPPGAVVAGEVVEADVVAESLKRLWKMVGFASKVVAVGIANTRVVARITDLPAMPDNELRTAIRFQAQDLIPIPLEDAELDFQVVGRMQDERGERVRLLVVAAQRDMLRSLLAAVEGAGLRAVRIDFTPLAMLRALYDADDWRDAGPGGEVLIGVGAGVTNILVHRDGVPQFLRTIPTPAAVTEPTAGETALDDDPLADGFHLPMAGSYPWEPPRTPASNALVPLASDLTGSLDFHLAQEGAAGLRRAVMTGGGPRLRPLRSLIHEQLGVDVLEAEPCRRVVTKKVRRGGDVLAAEPDRFTVAIGLAIARVDDAPGLRPVDLLPSEVAVRAAARRQVMLAGAGVAAVAVVLGGLAYERHTQVQHAKAEATAAEAKVTPLETQVQALSAVAKEQTQIQAATQQVSAALKGDIAWSNIVRDFAAALPSDVWIDTISGTHSPGAAVSTVTFLGTGSDQTSVANWLLRTEKVPTLADVWLTSSTKTAAGQGPTTDKFSATATLSPLAESRRLSDYLEAKL